MNRLLTIIIINLLIMSESCNSQNNKSSPNDRPAAVAGQFYAADSLTLVNNLKKLFSKAVPNQSKNVLAIISPHAGYIFSGEVAACSFNQIDADKEYTDIFVIGSSHREYFNGAAIFIDGNFITPLGVVEVDTSLGRKLLNTGSVFIKYNEAHRLEHSIEVQLPFLQYHMKKPFRIVPIILGTDDAETCEKIADVMAPYFNSDNLFVISSDFSHYPKYADAVKVDKLTSDAIQSNSTSALLKTIKSNTKLNIPNLLTSLCGWTSVLTMLYITEKIKDINIKVLKYKNSGDTPAYGDSSRVVGYNSIVITQNKTKNTEFTLSKTNKKDLLLIARNTLNEFIRTGVTPTIDSAKLSETIKQYCGAFVSLHKKGDLRGCIGQFTAKKPLYQIVQDIAKASATEDTRFQRVSSDELDQIDIEISVLSPLKKIQSIDEIELGKHGIYIIKGNYSGTFLPQVATQTGWTKNEFLGHCAEDKAGIGWNGWKDADIYIYTAVVFGEKESQ